MAAFESRKARLFCLNFIEYSEWYGDFSVNNMHFSFKRASKSPRSETSAERLALQGTPESSSKKKKRDSSDCKLSRSNSTPVSKDNLKFPGIQNCERSEVRCWSKPRQVLN